MHIFNYYCKILLDTHGTNANKSHTYKKLIFHDNSYYLELVLVARIPIAMPSIQKWKMVYMSVPSGRILFFVKLLVLLLLGTPENSNLQI